jgi:MFS family permease
MNNNPRKILNDSPMGIRQILVVGICVLLTALDGFDVLSISFASPGIAKDWGIDRAALGVVLSMELIGMALGSIFLGNMADRVGRRPIIIFCLLVMATGMFMAGSAQSVNSLLIHRFYTGLAIGGMLASTNAMVAEFSNSKRRNLSVILMAAGYPLGVIIGGVFAVNLLQDNSWRSIFVFG